MIRTGYSFNKAIGHIENVFSRLVECRYKSFPIVDYNSTFGFNRWNKLCEKAGVNPVFGVELSSVKNLKCPKSPISNWVFLARDNLKSLNDAISTATANPTDKPKLTHQNILEILDNQHLFVICNETTPIENLKEIRNASTLYVKLTPETPKGFYLSCKEMGLRFVACPENSYCEKQDRELYRLTFGKRAKTSAFDQHIVSDDELKEALYFVSDSDFKKAVSNRAKVLKSCNAKLKGAKVLVPEKEKHLKDLCVDGAKKLKIDLNKEYSERLDYEIDLIYKKNFEDYFYIIQDLVGWAKKHMIVGPARGSSCGSLVCYLLGITTIDPIQYGLIFERFIDINRDDLPDIDIDFSDQNRHLVFEYAENKFGLDRVARLGTVSLYRGKSSLKELSKSLDIPPWEVDKVTESIVDGFAGDDRAFHTLEDTLNTTESGKKFLTKYPESALCCGIEGHPRNASQHAAGIVITNSPINETVAIDERTRSCMCDKKDAEELDLLKIDALGLIQLSIFERTLELIGKEPFSSAGFLESIPLDDQASFDVINAQRYSGLFQWGDAVKSLSKDITFTTIEDFISINALSRPGPLSTGEAHKWVKRKNGTRQVIYKHESLKPFTENTLGVITYQEQVMFIVKELGGLSWADTSEVRKAMGKSKGREFLSKFENKFVKGAKKNGVSKKDAVEIWASLVSFGAYAFNRSHSVAYGIIAYWCCYFKAHYPLEFAAATLDNQKDPNKQIVSLRELKDEGVSYVPYDIEKSSDKWEIRKKDRVLVGPLRNIKGIGPAAEKEILECRQNNEPIRAALQKRIENSKTDIDTLYPVANAIKTLHPNLLAIGIETKPLPIEKAQCGVDGDVLLFGVADRIKQIDENEPERVKKRDGKIVTGPTAAVNIWLNDDTDKIFCKINRYDYNRLSKLILSKGRQGKSLFAFKGKIPQGFRMMSIDRVKYLGEIDDV
jgi:DNA polymerase III alpha subunit